jgi:DNA-binding beta-propeller fold protein YncE
MTPFTRSIIVVMAAGTAWSWPLVASATQAVKIWETPGFKNPESALYDKAAAVVYVSNVNGEATGKDGNGFISTVSLDGKVLVMEWVKGLDAPKGLAMAGGKLYTADIDKLVEIDPASGRILNRYEAQNAKFLNDVAADASGNVYVSDMATNTIWRLANGTFEIFLSDEKLESPNGLLAAGDDLIVGSWGVMTDGMATKVPGHLKAVSLTDKSIRSLGAGTPIGNLDAVEPLGDDAFLVTDWVAGKVIRLGRDGTVQVLESLGQGTADLGYDPGTGTAFIPQMKTGILYGFKIE